MFSWRLHKFFRQSLCGAEIIEELQGNPEKKLFYKLYKMLLFLWGGDPNSRYYYGRPVVWYALQSFRGPSMRSARGDSDWDMRFYKWRFVGGGYDYSTVWVLFF